MEKIFRSLMASQYDPAFKKQSLVTLLGKAAHGQTQQSVENLIKLGVEWLTGPNLYECKEYAQVLFRKLIRVYSQWFLDYFKRPEVLFPFFLNKEGPELADGFVAIDVILQTVKEVDPSFINEHMTLVLGLIGGVIKHVIETNKSWSNSFELQEIIAKLILVYPACKPSPTTTFGPLFLQAAWIWLAQTNKDETNFYDRVPLLVRLYLFIIEEYNIQPYNIVGQFLMLMTTPFPLQPTAAILLNQPRIAGMASRFSGLLSTLPPDDQTKQHIARFLRGLSTWPLTEVSSQWYLDIVDAIADTTIYQPYLYTLLPQYLPFVARQLYIPAFRSGALKVMEKVLMSSQASAVVFHSLLDLKKPILTPLFKHLIEKKKNLSKNTQITLKNEVDMISEDISIIKQSDLSLLIQVMSDEQPDIEETDLEALDNALERLARLCYIQCEKHSGHPERYIPLIKAMDNQWEPPSLQAATKALLSVKSWRYYEPEDVASEEEGVEPIKQEKLGFLNVGNNCYMASFLQALYHTEPLKAYLLSHVAQSSVTPSGRPTTTQTKNFNVTKNLQRLFGHLLLSTRPAVNPTQLKRCLGDPWNQFGQQDACEFGLAVLDNIEQVFPETSKNFSGKFIQTIKCSTCSHCSHQSEPFNTLTLQFPPDTPPSPTVQTSPDTPIIHMEPPSNPKPHPPTLEELVDFAFSEETMIGENQIFCSKCEKRQDGKKKMDISDPPSHLIINLARFQYNYQTNVHSKIFKNIYYPDHIIIPLATKDGNSEQRYSLYSVVIHSGLSAHSGHYYAYARSSQGASVHPDTPWYKLNDSSVGRSSYDSFSRITDSLSRDVPYLLFYVKEDLKLPLPENGLPDILPEIMREVTTDNEKYNQEIKQKKLREKQQQESYNHFKPNNFHGPGSGGDSGFGPGGSGGFGDGFDGTGFGGSGGFGGSRLIF